MHKKEFHLPLSIYHISIRLSISAHYFLKCTDIELKEMLLKNAKHRAKGGVKKITIGSAARKKSRYPVDFLTIHRSEYIYLAKAITVHMIRSKMILCT